MIRIGFWGTGAATGVADWHAAAFSQDGRARLTAVFNRTLIRSERWASRYGDAIRVCTSEQELWENCDAVVVCTPNALHPTQTEAAIRAGRHLLMEKPLCAGACQAKTLQELAARNGVVVAVGYVYRFAAPVMQMRRLVKEEFSHLYSIRSQMGGVRLADPRVPMEWRMHQALALAGALYDMGSHLVDTASFISGERISEVYCRTQTCLDRRQGARGWENVETDDGACMIASGENTLYDLSVTRVGPGPLQLTVTGDGGMLDLRIGAAEPLLFWKKDKQGGYATRAQAVPNSNSPQQEWFCRQAKAFLDRIEGNDTEISSLAESGYVDEVLLAAARSAHTKRTETVGAGR